MDGGKTVLLEEDYCGRAKALKLKLMFVIMGGLVATAGGLHAQLSDAPNSDRLKPLLDAMRKDLRTQKQSLIDEAMGLDAADKAKFWTVYQGFQKELDAIAVVMGCWLSLKPSNTRDWQPDVAETAWAEIDGD